MKTIKLWALVAAMLSAAVPATAGEKSVFSGFDHGPTYRALTKQDLFCSEHVGATAEEIAALRDYCEASGWIWQGRSNWTAFAKEKQRQHDALQRAQPAGFIELSYTEQVIRWNKQLDDAAAAFQLDDKTSQIAKKTAAAWMHLGPCEGAATDSTEDANSAVAVVIGAEPKIPFHASILSMIGMLSRENLGRRPPKELCRFAQDIANGR